MKKIILLILFTTYAIMANTFPQRIETTITSVNGDTIKLAEHVSAGVSGVVVHDYGNGLSAITHSLITTKNGDAKLLPYRAIIHDNIPSVKTEVNINDKIILGNYYNNVLLISPNEQTYSSITKQFNKNWIHPDSYAIEFMKEELSQITLDSLYRFAIKNQVGLVLLVTNNSLLFLDPISKKIIKNQPFTISNKKAMRPFFSRFPQMDISDFGLSSVKLEDYYKSIREIK